LKEKLQAGKIVIGTWAIIPSVVTADIIASTGIDFIVIDSEHGPIQFETAQSMVIACESWEVSPVMRVGGLISNDILRALDIGVHCIQVPNIMTLQELKDTVNFCKYPPSGNRGFSPFTRAGGYTHENAQKLTTQANESTMLAIHIEGREAIENLDDILSVKEVDIIFIGLYDLSKAFGIPGQVDDPRIISIVQSLIEKISKAGKYPGTIVTDDQKLEQFIDLGMKYITYSVDCEMLRRSYDRMSHNFRKQANQGLE
jgi:4-hydroxy-2-oxoheptanedioate aldolase